VVADSSTLALPVLPLRNGVVFPDMVVTLTLETAEARRAVAASESSDGLVLLLPRHDDEYARVGTVARIEEIEGGDSIRAAVMRGISRASVVSGRSGTSDVLWVDAVTVEEDDPGDVADLVQEYRAVVREILDQRGIRGAERLLQVDDPGRLADLAVYSPDLPLPRKIELLETVDVRARLEKVLGWMREVLADIDLQRRVREGASERIDKSQREFLLRQQLAAIKAELGEGAEDESGGYRERIEAAGMPEAVRDAALREVDRLERTSEQSPEHSWIRTWLDTLLDVPWAQRSEDRLDLGAAREVLDTDHTGLDDVKDRIIEHLAVRKLRAERGMHDGANGPRRGEGAIVLLVGPPGVGKTSLGESVARALGRSFGRIALGGIRDEAEIRGHRRTYVGSRPGRIVRSLVEAKTMNPVLLLDETDKVGADWRGDPSSALLEVLDPAQNHTFRDNYLEVDLDLSDVLFIATANVVETIPAPLLDRMEVIRLDGYTAAEKTAIARDHLLPRRVEQAGLLPEEVVVSDEALAAIIDGYTREAGVRQLERQLGKLTRKLATKVATGTAELPVAVEPADLRDLIGKRTVHHDEAADRTSLPGVATGLAVTGAGGDVLFIEATAMDGEPGLTITGQLGDVMKESAQIALSFVRSHAVELGIEPASLERRFHLHVPAGAVPKDGPSAGVTMVTALVSLLTGRTVHHTVGMTGEVTLQGRVLPIGGVKQKVLAAHRAGLRQVVIPARNADDLDDVPEGVRADMTLHTLDDVRDVLAVAFGDDPAAHAA
jgi:ATP-dependent Lon protease